MYKILCVGPMWRGSNAGGLFRAFSRLGHLISEVDPIYYVPLSGTTRTTKIVQKLFRNIFIKEFNEKIQKAAELFKPDFILVYKGAFVKAETLNNLKKAGYPLINFYPDVSFMAHGPLLKITLPIYDHIFTTKTFGILDMKEHLGIKNASFIPHGFDPGIHRQLMVNENAFNDFHCDVSFIGGHSHKKEKLLSALKGALPGIHLKIWGERWESSKSDLITDSIQYRGIMGDLYALGIQMSSINLGLLHEKVMGSRSGDRITSRTFHIPASGGFMIHERTDEVLNYFKEDEEIVCYNGEEELIEKVKYYLDHPQEREQIRLNGYKRALKDHALDQRANQVLEILKNRGIVK